METKILLTLLIFIFLCFLMSSGLSQAGENIDEKINKNISVTDIDISKNKNVARVNYIISGTPNESYRIEFNAFDRESGNSSHIYSGTSIQTVVCGNLSKKFKKSSAEVLLPDSQNNNYTIVTNVDNGEFPNFYHLNTNIADTYTPEESDGFEYQRNCYKGDEGFRNNNHNNQDTVENNNILDLLFVLWFPVILIVIFIFIITFIKF